MLVKLVQVSERGLEGHASLLFVLLIFANNRAVKAITTDIIQLPVQFSTKPHTILISDIVRFGLFPVCVCKVLPSG